MSKYKYDLFLSYNHADSDIVESLASHLQEAGVSIWFDRSQGSPGKIELQNENQAIKESHGIGISIGPKGTNNRVNKTIQVALATRQLNPSYGVIPILLPGSAPTDIPLSLRGLTFIDLREGIKSGDAINKLISELRAEAADEIQPSTKMRSSLKLRPSPSIPAAPEVGFVTRSDAEGRDLVMLLKEELAPKNQLVALWGAGGVGKTTLAAETARSLADSFRQRIVWVSADTRGDFTLTSLLDDIATQLGQTDLRKLAPGTKEEKIQALLATAPTLIVLDNFEIIAPSEQIECMEWIAQQVSCSTLTTSRQVIKAARNIPITTMSQSEAAELLSRLISQARDQSVFSKLDHDVVIRMTEGNPLVLQWIFAQINLSDKPEEVLSELKGRGNAVQRVFDRYFSLPQLTDDGRAVLLSLSIFMPNAARLALAKVAGLNVKKKTDEERLDKAIERITDLGLVRKSTKDRSLALEGLTREMTRARLVKDERAVEYYRRFVACFVDYAEENARPTPEGLDALESEKDNVLTAMDVAFKLEDWESVMRIMNAIAFPGMLDTRGYWDEAIKRSKQAAKAAKAAKKELAAAYFTVNAATIRWYRGEYKEAKRSYQQALEDFKRLKSDLNIAATLHKLGNMAFELGDLDDAKRFYEEALQIAEKFEDQQGIAVSLHQLGRIAQLKGDLEAARWNYMKASEIAIKRNDQGSLASTYHQLGTMAQLQGDLKQARQYYNASLKTEKELGDQSAIASTLQQLGMIAQDQGDMTEARKLYNESLEIKKKLGDQSGIAITLNNLGLLAKIEGNESEAAALLSEALSIFEKVGSPHAELARRNLDSVRAQSAAPSGK